MEPHANTKYVNITLRHTERDLNSWLTERTRDALTENIVKATKSSELALFALQSRLGRELSPDEIEAHLRRGWSYMRNILGTDQAVRLTKNAGTVTTVAATLMLDEIETFQDLTRKQKYLDELLYVPTLSRNIVELLAEHNGCDGKSIGEKLASVVSMTDAERESFRQSCEHIDFSTRTIH